ncbi:MAG: hypothetical protein LBJ08_00095 [Bifidobacteriaceae bacterium]|jgi:hypothetical protein|nr:hypothetical protein [Bifidobacteriaceae bacterium]
MFQTAPPPPSDLEFPPLEQSLARTIREHRQTDPTAGIRTGSKLFRDKLIGLLNTDPNGVRAELLLAVPAMLAGFACQAATWEALVVGQGRPLTSVFAVFGTDDGGQYPFSNAMNQLLLEGRSSVWAVVATAAQSMTDSPLLDVEEIAAHVARSVGTPDFAQPRLPPSNSFGNDDAMSIISATWPAFLPLLGLCCEAPREWPLLFAAALPEAMKMTSHLIEPASAASIIMESAVPMAHLPMRPI